MRGTALLPLLLGFLLLAALPAAQAQGANATPSTAAPAVSAASAPPAPPKPEKVPSAERGKVVFESKASPACKTCHGEAGDGSGAPSLQPPPANFHDLNRFGVRSDADLWDVITNGKPKDAPIMPAFKDHLSDQDKWDVIAYIRTTFMYQSAAGAGGPPPAEGVHLRAYWLGLIGMGASFLLMAVSFAVIRFTKKR